MGKTTRMKKKKNYKIVSLFSGCGGMDLGSEGGFVFLGKKYKKHPIQTVYAMDFDAPICEVYNANFPLKIDVRDIRELKSDEIPDHDILTGGFPCQSFSVVAQNPKRLGYKDARSNSLMINGKASPLFADNKPFTFSPTNTDGFLSFKILHISKNNLPRASL
jgi:DNA (cytosine-5)-methyltransferase 1